MKTVAELNKWISRFFIALYGAKMAYVSFPIDISINGAAMQVEYRVTFGTIALTGPEDLCCQAVSRELLLHAPRADHQEILLIRHMFTYDAASQSLYGRIAFWDPHRQKQLSFSSRIYKPEGCITLHVSEL